MAHPEQEAVEAGPSDPLDDIAKFLDDEPEEEAPEGEESEDDTEGDEPEEEPEGEGDEGDEPTEAIKPPVSLNKEQRAAFEQLPPDLQKVWADTEAQRNRDVQIKTTEAAEAKRNATAQAQAELVQVQRQYAQEVEILAEALKPAKPDYGLLATNPQAFAEQMAIYEQLSAHHEQIMERVAGVRQQADQIDGGLSQAQVAADEAKLVREWPEWADPAKRPAIAQQVAEMAIELGYAPEVISQANASDVLAIRKAMDWKGKAEKWDAFQARKMQNVRAAKALPKVSTPGNAPSRNASKAQRADNAWQRAKQSRSGDDFADFLEAKGIL